MRRIAKIGKVFYVDGNHEIYLKEFLDNAYLPVYERYESDLQEAGVQLLHNESVKLDEQIVLYGHEFSYEYYRSRGKVNMSADEMVKAVGCSRKDTYTVLLTHDPTKFDVYADWGADLIASGHMHGGVIRIGDRGLIGADRTVFPRYCYGKYQKGDSTLIVTGGLGEHSIWKRMFNPPEVVIIQFNKAERMQ